MKKQIKTIPVNGELLRITRQEMGLSLREFSKVSRTNIAALNTMEKCNVALKTTPILELNSVAAACGLTLADLLTPKPETFHPEPAEDNILVMAQQLAAILARDNRLHSKLLIAEHFNITLTTLRKVTTALNHLATPLGLRIHEHTSLIALRPMDPKMLNQFEKIDRRRANTDGYTMTDAALVNQALHGFITEAPNHAERPRLGRLIRLGVLRPGAVGKPLHVLTEKAAFAFDIPGVTIDLEYAPSIKPNATNRKTVITKRSKSSNATRNMTMTRSKKGKPE